MWKSIKFENRWSAPLPWDFGFYWHSLLIPIKSLNIKCFFYASRKKHLIAQVCNTPLRIFFETPRKNHCSLKVSTSSFRIWTSSHRKIGSVLTPNPHFRAHNFAKKNPLLYSNSLITLLDTVEKADWRIFAFANFHSNRFFEWWPSFLLVVTSWSMSLVFTIFSRLIHRGQTQ